MIHLCIKRALPALQYLQIQPFCYKKTANSAKAFLKNDNLTYEDQHHKLSTYFFLPELKKTQQKTYEINKDSNVLSLVWEPKQKKQVEFKDDDMKNAKQESGKLSFSFKFPELQSLLEVLPKSNSTALIERKRNAATSNVFQTLNLIDNPAKKIIHFNYNSTISNKSSTPTETSVFFEFAYSQHRIFQTLLRQSLFELSGMGLLYELKRIQELNSSENEALQKKAQIDKEVQQFYKRF